jgi:hypothetical protein
LQLGRIRLFAVQVVDLFVQRLNARNRRAALGLHADVSHAGMAEAGANAAADTVGESFGGAHIVE